MSIVVNLQKHIIQNEKNITDILRKALLIASKLKLVDFKEWINHELKGYESNNIPNYRKLRGKLRFFDPYHGWKPSTITDIKTDNLINQHNIHQSISELESLINKPQDAELSISFNGHKKKVIMDFFNTDCEPTAFISKTQIIGIVDQVKTSLLEWSLKLEEEGIIGDENMSFSENEKNNAQQNINITNFNGVMGDIDNLGNISTGNHNKNKSITHINSKIDNLIEKMKPLRISDKEEIIQNIKMNKDNKEKLSETLGELLTKGSEVSTIVPYIGEILGMLG